MLLILQELHSTLQIHNHLSLVVEKLVAFFSHSPPCFLDYDHNFQNQNHMSLYIGIHFPLNVNLSSFSYLDNRIRKCITLPCEI